jgi:hypothetical protein
MPIPSALPRPLALFLRLPPLEEQETSYFAASANIFSLSFILLSTCVFTSALLDLKLVTLFLKSQFI